VDQRSGWRAWGQRLTVVGMAATIPIAALAGIVAVAPEISSPSIAGAANVYTETVSGSKGECSPGWFTNSGVVVPSGVVSTQIALTGGGGGGSTSHAGGGG
jgi:hypothetical protein